VFVRALLLYQMIRTTIERHIKVRGTAKPYNPRYTQYFAQRRCYAAVCIGQTKSLHC
jgi:hypothetical protein